MKVPASFRYSIDPNTAVATIMLDRPDRMNALTFEVYRELRDLFLETGAESDVRAIVITGAGNAFCTGGDVRDIVGPLLERPAQELLAFTALTCDLIRGIRECPRPVVAAVNGTAAGAGAMIAAACDLRIAAPSARIAFLFVKVGRAGADIGAAWLLPRLVGLGRASELLLTGEFITAEEAHRIGLYNRIVADGAVVQAAQEAAAALARGPLKAMAATKTALNREAGMDLTAALHYEAGLQAALMTEPDFRDAYDAFVGRRTPKFR